MDIGKLRDRVELQRWVEREDSYGQKIRTPTTYAHIWANVQEVASAETIIAMQLAAGTTLIISARWRDDVEETHQVKMGQRVFGLTGRPVNPDGKKIEMIIGAREWKG